MKLMLSILLALSLFWGVAGQAQAAAVPPCTTQATCKVGEIEFTCKGVIGAPGNTDRDRPETPDIENGKCSGPCEVNTDCDGFKSAPFNFSAVQCTGKAGSPGVCAELPPGAKQLSAGPQSGTALLNIVDAVTGWVFAIFTILAIIFVLLAAFQFVTAGGEATKVGEARQKLIWAAVGIIIALLAKGVVPVIKAIVGG